MLITFLVPILTYTRKVDPIIALCKDVRDQKVEKASSERMK
jgi:hypothetical protein